MEQKADGVSEVEIENEEAEVVCITSICRLCANQNNRLIGIYSEEGLSNDLANKINLYLPVKVSISDELPLQCCWNCASTLLGWHELVIASVESDRRFRSCQIITQKVDEYENIGNVSSDDNDNEGIEPTDPLTTSLNDFCQTEEVLGNEDGIKKITTKPSRRKQKQDFIGHYPLQGKINPLEKYITEIDDNFIVNGELSQHIDNINEYKIDIGEHELLEADIKSSDIKQLSVLGTDGTIPLKTDDQTRPSYFACQYCSGVFLLKKDVLIHIQNEHPGKECVATPVIEPIPQQIPRVNIKKEKRKNNKLDQELINEAKVTIDGRIYYNCKECGKSLHSPYTYIWHMRIHTGERPYVCDLCGKQFRVSQGLVRHLRETHQGIKKFPCDICGRMFATRRNVDEHRRIHTNERPYICDLCGKSFKQKASLFVHKRSHKNYFPFKCSYCNQGFRTKPPLMVHITRHTGEKPYKCDICGRCFRIKYELKRHQLIHSEEKPFACSLCGLTFRQKRYLRNHTKSNHSIITV